MGDTEAERDREQFQSASPGKRAAQSVQNWPWSAVHIITQPSAAWSDAYLDKHAARTQSLQHVHTTRQEEIQWKIHG